MDPNSLKAFIRLISKEKDLPPEILKEAIEHAILAASRKQLSRYRDAVANLDMDTGQLTVTVTKTVTEDVPPSDHDAISQKEARKLLKDRKIKAGDEVRIPIDPSEFGRIAAQSARQMVMQRLRDAERTKVFTEYKDKEGLLVTGLVQRFERRDVILNIGRAEGVLPPSEQPAGAHYRFNDRLKVLIERVDNTTKGPLIILTRKSPQLVIELFRQEVPEIADGTVQIVGVAREAGVRTKIAVRSVNSDVDPVGACVGMKGSRVQMVVRELENEKIDIVPWSSETSTFIRNALNPAKIVGIQLDEQHRRAEVTVAQGNLAIAIGRKGQNTKLAARLTGYRLDIKSENEEELAYEEIQRRYLEDFLEQIEGLSDLYREALLRSGFNSVEKIAKAEPAKLMPFTGDNEALVENLIHGATEYVDALREMENERKRMLTESEGEGAEGEDAEGEGAEGEDAEGESAESEGAEGEELEESSETPAAEEAPEEDEPQG
ncbi:MAG: transcription termination factor NusA [Candidatus Sumerlaeia bacterium]